MPYLVRSWNERNHLGTDSTQVNSGWISNIVESDSLSDGTGHFLPFSTTERALNAALTVHSRFRPRVNFEFWPEGSNGNERVIGGLSSMKYERDLLQFTPFLFVARTTAPVGNILPMSTSEQGIPEC
jgi:hypothetical protein